MERRPGSTNLSEAVRSVQMLKIDGYCATDAMGASEYIRSRWNIDGHDWEVRVYPKYYNYVDPIEAGLPFDSELDDYLSSEWVALKLILLGEPQRNELRVNVGCRLVDPSGQIQPSVEKTISCVFSRSKKSSSDVLLLGRHDIPSSGYLVNDLLTVQCTITVLKELSAVVTSADDTEATLPPSDLERHFGALWQGQRGADVTFLLESGERIHAHKIILAARSPVFMAEFFGGMNERRSQSVRIEDMDAGVFKAMLQFIYTDRAPELDEEPEFAVTMAQHLLAAANRYGLDRLKLICGRKLAGGISIDTVATTLALAEQHNCSLLKTKCVDFIARSPETLDAVLATEGYNDLVSRSPRVVDELLRAAHGRRI